MDFRVLAVGDVVGNPGLEQIRRNLRQMKRQYHADFAVVNGENAAGLGLLPQHAEELFDAGADGISLINTMLGMRIDLRTRKPVIANKMGGFSGPAIFPIALRMVYQVSHAVNIPVIGMGGVSTAEDVIEMMYAGATAVQVGAANLKNPYACKEIIEDLPKVMEKYGIKDLNDIIGKA